MIRGRASVVNTGKLRINGRDIRLYGVNGRRGTYVNDLQSYLGEKVVRCAQRPNGRYRCVVSGFDLSEVVLLNGAGKAARDATPALKAAEDKARQQRKGVWR